MHILIFHILLCLMHSWVSSLESPKRQASRMHRTPCTRTFRLVHTIHAPAIKINPSWLLNLRHAFCSRDIAESRKSKCALGIRVWCNGEIWREGPSCPVCRSEGRSEPHKGPNLRVHLFRTGLFSSSELSSVGKQRWANTALQKETTLC